ncbi:MULTISPECIES: ATP-dependent DNA ligase [unclassified Modestobacter]|uniref:ATP-dependent DNA ligase n=1 Tax=unclassified Modestobacter TaxID=2643866 RepID=UPI0022AAB37C|nr:MULTISPECIES: ATP-dependent DNA ligase [unclassified Modestobacter]MCZ2814356.1 ATP-dependent DNA ligase [Modestobacter sp. VKM Ac-2979]MCZ2843952.1 ATP-dependent DNA ligase [Modestobacter sp. VKM Ac-2980]MCZ2850631.1 ATP-dependent DNA ligase [Modestobacter sp. VKM Ac-2978]
MDLPVNPPVKPMLAKPVATLPTGDGWFYEPKWDGFRCIVFRDGDEVELGSRNERPLTRYFPDVVEAVKAQLPERCVVDGEIVVPRGDRLDFESLLQRIHPAASRVTRLAEETPASFVAFDLLALGDDSLMDSPYADRQARLREALAGAQAPVYVSTVTSDAEVGQRWFAEFEGAGLDGVIAKRGDQPYSPDQRVMTKVKHVRAADCVVAGFRWHKSGPVVGSLLLGLYDDAGTLQHIGVAASFTMKRRAELVDELAPYRAEALDGHPWQDWANAQTGEDGEHRMPGATSRWNAGKDLSWVPLRPELVVEIKYDQLEGSRLRHTGHFLRWRTDRDARSCTYEQLEVPVRYDLAEVLGG